MDIGQVNLAVIGYGNRGSLYAKYARTLGAHIVGVCDTDEKRRAQAVVDGVPHIFSNQEDFFDAHIQAEAVIIATMDKQHFSAAIKALKSGYDLLLEKPISPDENECYQIVQVAKEYNRKVVICHVLRYAPFFATIKRLLDSQKFGDIIDITMTENIGYYHFSHSYVRGNWRNFDTSAPVILAKSCHDLDILCWLIGKPCISVSSYGNLKHFKSENAPAGSADFCKLCSVRDNCSFDCFKIYKNQQYNEIAGLAKHGRLGAGSEIDYSLSTEGNPYGRCVYKCDNSVCDHQVVNMLFAENITAQFTLTAFSESIDRTIRIHCSNGEIFGCLGKNRVHSIIFGKEPIVYDFESETEEYKTHGGGDFQLVKQFLEYICNNQRTTHITEIDVSLMSHKIAFAAEESRLENGKLIYLRNEEELQSAPHVPFQKFA